MRTVCPKSTRARVCRGSRRRIHSATAVIGPPWPRWARSRPGRASMTFTPVSLGHPGGVAQPQIARRGRLALRPKAGIVHGRREDAAFGDARLGGQGGDQFGLDFGQFGPQLGNDLRARRGRRRRRRAVGTTRRSRWAREALDALDLGPQGQPSAGGRHQRGVDAAAAGGDHDADGPPRRLAAMGRVESVGDRHESLSIRPRVACRPSCPRCRR